MFEMEVTLREKDRYDNHTKYRFRDVKTYEATADLITIAQLDDVHIIPTDVILCIHVHTM